MSPHDTFGEVMSVIDLCLDGDTQLVWVLLPGVRQVLVFRRGGSSMPRLAIDDTITGGEVLPGFEAKVASFFA